jgi:LysW-gamma-L-lysine carboxypeptidase
MDFGEEYPVNLLKRMLEIYSPSGEERNLSLFLAEELKKLGFERVWRNRVGNVYGEIGSGEPSVLLCGHMDTIPGWIPVRVEDNKLYGRGAVDAKSSLAAMIVAAASLRKYALKGRIMVACIVDEEGKSRGIKRFLREKPSVNYAIFGEPSGINKITFAYKGHLKLKIRIKSSTGHVGAQHLLYNAAEKCFEIWARIKGVCEEKYRSTFGIFYSLTPAILRICSRGSTRSIPDECTLIVDFRLPPTISCQKTVEVLKDLIENFRMENNGLIVDFNVTDTVEPYVADRDTIVIKALREAILEETGENAKLIRKTGTGDMNIFGAHFKIPVATYGPGDSSLSHTLNEHIEIPEFLTSIKVYKRAVEKILEFNSCGLMV